MNGFIIQYSKHPVPSGGKLMKVKFVYLFMLVCAKRAVAVCRGQLKCDGTCAEIRFRLSTKRTSPFKSAGGRQFSRLLAAEVCPSASSNAGYTMFRGSVKSTGYPLHSPVSPLLPFPCVTVCHNISTGV